MKKGLLSLIIDVKRFLYEENGPKFNYTLGNYTYQSVTVLFDGLKYRVNLYRTSGFREVLIFYVLKVGKRRYLELEMHKVMQKKQ